MCLKPTTTARQTLRLMTLCMVVAAWSVTPARAQQPLTQQVVVRASFADRVKVSMDRTNVVFDTEAYDSATVAKIVAAPLTITAKARVTGNARIVMQVQADGPLRSATATIPANKVTWTTTGPGFHANGIASANAPRTIGSWRGSGSWVGTQTYEFADDWTYAVGVYTMTMTYTISMP